MAALYNEIDPYAAQWLRLRAYGNAIVPPLAAEVVKALMETLDV